MLEEKSKQIDHDLLIRIDTRLQDLIRDNKDYKISIGELKIQKCDKDEVNDKMYKYEKTIDIKIVDHEKRVRKIERFVYIATGGFVILQFIIAR